MELYKITTSLIPESLITTYLNTNFTVLYGEERIILRIDDYSKPLNNLHARNGLNSSAYITACNPHSEIYTLEQNTARQIDLQNDLESLKCVILSGEGQDTEEKWAGEPSFLAIGIPKYDACLLGQKYDQNAIVYSGEDAIPSLILLR